MRGSRVAQSQTANLLEVVSVDATPLRRRPAHVRGVSKRSLKSKIPREFCHRPRSHPRGSPFGLQKDADSWCERRVAVNRSFATAARSGPYIQTWGDLICRSHETELRKIQRCVGLGAPGVRDLSDRAGCTESRWRAARAPDARRAKWRHVATLPWQHWTYACRHF